ncbi:MAG: Crp/Fnr family transcriptional regulator [Bacteroidota bacterium]
MPTPEKFQKLREYYNYLLPTMTGDSWQICESVLTVRKLKKGDLLLKEGDVCKYVSFMNYGLVRMYQLIDGKEKIIRFFNERTYVADYNSFLTREPALTYLQAMEDTEVAETSYEGLQMLYKEVPEANMLGRLVAEELFIDMCRRNTKDLCGSLEQQYNILVEQQPWMLQRVPQYMIASYLGITPEALSRIKARVSKRKLVVV